MPMNSIRVGAFLILLGGVVTVLSGTGSVTSLIPSFIGVIFVALGLVARMKPDLSHHMMHGAAALALLALLGSIGSLIGRASSATGWSVLSQVATIVVCAGFLFLAVQSFKAARLARTAG